MQKHRFAFRMFRSGPFLNFSPARRMTALFFTFLLLLVNVHTQAQTVTLRGKDLSLKQVFKAIEQQTGYVVFANKSYLNDTKGVAIDANAMPLRQFMEACTKDQPFGFTIADNTITLTPKVKSKSGENTVPAKQLIEGKVSGVDGQVLEGASIRVKGNTNGTYTDRAGKFSIDAYEGDVLIISFVGFESREYKIGNNHQLNIVLSRASITAGEVVISTGYQQKKVSEITGALQTIKGDDLRKGVSTVNALAMLKGRASGLYIVENGGSVATRGQVVMRGQASMPDQFNTNFGPLLVIDGVITNVPNLQDIVNPNDIESITILKDAASTAIYGSRAAQGVIVVVTRHGANGKMKIGLNTSYGKVKNNRLVNYMNTSQLTSHIRNHMTSLYAASPSLNSIYGSFDNYFNTTRIYTDDDLQHDYDWSNKTFYPDGNQSDINLSMSGGNEKIKVYTALDWTRQDGTILGDNLDRKAFRLNLDQRINNKLTLTINTNVLVDKYTSSTSENQNYLFLPWVSPYYANGALADSVPNYIYNSSGKRGTVYYDNPLYSYKYNTAITKRQSYLLTGKLKYDILPWLSVQTTNTFQYINNNLNSYKDPRTYRGRYDGPANNRIYVNGALTVSDDRTNYFLTSNLITASKQFGEHVLTALAGQEYGKSNTSSFAVSVYGSPYPGERTLGAFQNYGTYINKLFGTIATPSAAAPVEKGSFSVFGELNDSYREKYFASASLRRDASTNFGRNNRYGTFYSLSAGWLISKEVFMKSVKPVTNLKLRAAYGTSGREAGADYLNFTTYTDVFRYNDANTYGSTIQRLGNDQITWETTYTTNIGLDLELWKRINMSADVYNRRSAGLLQSVQLPTYIGFATQIRNIGELTNKGIDLNLSTVNVQTKDFKWTTEVNISFNKNRLTKIYGDSLIDGFTGNYYRYKGEDINTLKAIPYLGVNADNGRPLFQRTNADKSVSIVDSLPLAKAAGLQNYLYMGTATPKFFGGFTNTFAYRNFTLSALFNFSYGNKIVNNNMRNFMDPTGWQNGFNVAAPTKEQHFWKAPGDKTANYPNFYDPAFSQRGATNLGSSLLYQDASYLRLRNIRLSYDFLPRTLQKISMSSLSVYVSVDNVFVIKNKELYASDPEGATIGGASNSYAGTGINGAMPRRFVIGLNAGF
ncbi:TonB-linked outer membrane protein, SusC/RagA family [Chitinophaga sp. YR627]|uniref:SusC/RagA family TonB-linked outer membrane protein n=1 Tax=Chitinophaga sp. YR627 TaxID=1881041 RepID=UPI0008EA8BFA|nr:SusC/RagA family TonB-linked outer membrane protein [Chitinophaga sp. YR627]SFN33489.1 TonB-linked outer membrane protein, SusC/RagA family [Chitinophaga sp. YR627]